MQRPIYNHRRKYAWFATLLLSQACFMGCQSKNEPPQSNPLTEAAVAELIKQSATPAAVIPRRVDAVDDPNSDGWTTEVISQQAGDALNRILADAITPTGEGQLPIASDFRSTQLRQVDLVQISEEPIQVVRWKRPAIETNTPTSLIKSLVEGVRQDGSKDLGKKAKITRVDTSDDHPVTELRLELYDKSPERSSQITAVMDCTWQTDATNDLKLAKLDLKSLEQVTIQSTDKTWFREVTPFVMKQATSYATQMLHDNDYWAQRIERPLGANFMGNHGISVGDVNGDLLDDLYVPQTGGIPNRLYIQQPDGTLREASDSGVDILDATRAALIIDLDNDGDEDLVVASITGTLFYENVGDVRFAFRYRERTAAFGYSIVAADYDLDGDLDVYACCYNAPANSELPNPAPYHDARNGPPNVLIANDGDWQFHNATEEAGLNVENDRWTYAASWQDVDADGDPDLYVPNDFGRNWLLINENGKFTNRAAEMGVEDIASGMSAAWGDVNRDGRMDVYVSNMFSSAGNRVTYQRKFKEDSQAETKQSLQRLARGNTLFEAQSDGSFRDVTMAAKVEMGRWAWSSNFIEVNNDGWPDLVVANGNYTGIDTGDL